MSYDKYSIPLISPREGYNRLADTYHTFHGHLNSFDNGRWLRLLPRDMKGKRVLCLGAGDGRERKSLRDMQLGSYVAMDIAEKLLARHPSGSVIQKIHADADQNFVFENESFDVILAFIVLEYLNDLDHVFGECSRVLVPGGRIIATHFIQRRSMVLGHGDDGYKIENNGYRFDEIEKRAEYHFFSIDAIDIREGNTIVGKVYCFQK